ncbi:hypothetical protein [Burkholderia sp. LMG 21824]|uniref:hypothetical protein n=1 Tax=Burkholderia sp. LMG 21824 TaxID=3158172 RepID=UPI003C2C4EF8
MDLHQLVQQHAQTFPWYGALVRACGADAGRLETLPPITEAILTDHYYHDERPLPEPVDSYLTSGTRTGRRKRIRYSHRDQQLYLQQRTEIIRRFCGNELTRACADLGTGHAAATAGQIFQSMGCQVELIDFARPIDEHVRVLNRFKPEIFFTMPMILDRLVASGKLDFQPKKILVLGDVASSSWQASILDYFALPRGSILDLYGSIEIGSIAHYRHDIDRYVLDAYLLPEVVTPEAIYPGSSYRGRGGLLLLTSFARDYFPAIRFVTDDLIEGFAREIVDGRPCYTFDRCLGRFAAEYKHGEKINLSDISDAIAKHLPLRRYDLEDGGGKLTIRIGDRSVDSAVLDAIRRDILSRNPDVAQMIASGLVEDIGIERVDTEDIADDASKRRY